MQYRKTIPCEECYEWDEENISVCCGSRFSFPGWPDSDICSACGEHSDAFECEECNGTGVKHITVSLPKIIIDELNRTDRGE